LLVVSAFSADPVSFNVTTLNVVATFTIDSKANLSYTNKGMRALI